MALIADPSGANTTDVLSSRYSGTNASSKIAATQGATFAAGAQTSTGDVMSIEFFSATAGI